MRRFKLLRGSALLITVMFVAPTYGAGYWNVPSSFCQCAGYGCGAGYHAPLVLGPVSCKGWLAKNQVRLPYSPRPPYEMYGCSHCDPGGQLFDTPTMLEPAAFPPTAPLPAPAPAPAAFRGPLRY